MTRVDYEANRAFVDIYDPFSFLPQDAFASMTDRPFTRNLVSLEAID
jgi:hypothetical protein